MLDLTGTDPDILHKGTAGKGKKVSYYASHELLHYASHGLIHYVSHDVTIVFIHRGTLEY